MESLLVELISLPKDLLDSIIHVGGRSLEFNMDYIISNYRYIAKACPGYNTCIDSLVKRFNKSYDFSLGFDRFNPNDPFFKYLGVYIRKIVSFAEYEGKTRIIALMDYWSQVALEPLSTEIYNILSLIPQDQTFDQVGGCEDLPFDTQSYYSLDVSSFTDRFPSFILRELLSVMYGNHLSESIMNILCGFPFWSSDTNDFLSYSVGNPMGSRAS